MAEKQLIVVVEGSAAMRLYWQTIVSDYLHKIIRSFCCVSLGGLNPSTSNFELSLVMFNAHGSNSACLVSRSDWTRDVDMFLQWLSAIPLVSGGFGDAAIAEGLAEALMMFTNASKANQTPLNVDCSKHCILIAASNPYPLPTPVYQPLQIVEKDDANEARAHAEGRLSDAEAVAISYAQCAVSLSVICPKQLPKIRAIYNAAKRNPQGADPPVDNVKNPQYSILVSENFMEACAALTQSGITSFSSHQSPVKIDISSAPPGTPVTSVPTVNGSVMNRQPISLGNIPIATVKAEATTLTSGAYPHLPFHSPPVSQGVPILPTSTPSAAPREMISRGDGGQELKPMDSNMPQSLPPVNPTAKNVSILNNLSQARQVTNSAALAGGAFIGVQAQNDMANPGMSQQVQPGIKSLGGSNSLTATIPLSQQASTSALQSAAQSKYVKDWEGNLFGLRQGQPVFITRLEGYRSASASETISANWPDSMHIVRLLSQDHMNNKQFVGMTVFFAFRAFNQHGFLGQLLERKLDSDWRINSRQNVNWH